MKATLSLASIFTVEAREYENISFTQSDADTVSFLILGLLIGIVLAALYTLYQRNVPGALVRALLSKEALSPETAKTLAELGFEKNRLITFELRHNAVLQKMLRVQASEEGSEAPCYFIPEELKYRAENRFEKKGNGPLQFVITTVLAVGLAFLLTKLIPLVLSIIDGIL